MRRMLSFAAMLMLAAGLGLSAPKPPGQGGSSQDEEALRKVQEGFAAAWNQHDATAMSMFWAEDGDWIGPDGNLVEGRAAVENYLAENHTGDWATSKLSVKVSGVRFLNPDVAVVNMTLEISGARDELDKPLSAQKVVATSVLVKKDGKWLTAVYRAFIPPPPSED